MLSKGISARSCQHFDLAAQRASNTERIENAFAKTPGLQRSEDRQVKNAVEQDQREAISEKRWRVQLSIDFAGCTKVVTQQKCRVECPALSVFKSGTSRGGIEPPTY
jgi:hypothetical protein